VLLILLITKHVPVLLRSMYFALLGKIPPLFYGVFRTSWLNTQELSLVIHFLDTCVQIIDNYGLTGYIDDQLCLHFWLMRSSFFSWYFFVCLSVLKRMKSGLARMRRSFTYHIILMQYSKWVWFTVCLSRMQVSSNDMKKEK